MFQNTTDDNAFVLSKHRFLAKVKQEQVSIIATIRQPFQCEDNQWLCAASVAGLFHRKKDLEGATPEEAVAAARRFLVEEFNGFVATGGKLFTVDDAPIVKMHGLFDTSGADAE